MSDQAVADPVVVDENKTPQQYIDEASKKYIIPRLVREKFVDLVKLIYETESMNAEERAYWLQIMPIMTEEQIVKFRQILVNEKEQLAKLDTEYEAEMQKMQQPTPKKSINELKLREKLQDIEEKETSHEEAEKMKEEELLKQIEGFNE